MIHLKPSHGVGTAFQSLPNDKLSEVFTAVKMKLMRIMKNGAVCEDVFDISDDKENRLFNLLCIYVKEFWQKKKLTFPKYGYTKK